MDLFCTEFDKNVILIPINIALVSLNIILNSGYIYILISNQIPPDIYMY